MAAKTITRYQGIGIPDHRFTLENLNAKGGGTTDAAYTQAGPYTGVPVPSNTDGMVLEATGTQSEDGSIELMTRQSGTAGDKRSSYVWRDLAAGDGASSYKGQDTPLLVTGVDFAVYTSTGGLRNETNLRPITLASGDVLVCTAQSASTGAILLGKFSGSAGTWSNTSFTPDRVKDSAGSIFQQYGPAFVQLASGEVLCVVGSPAGDQVDVYVSEDDGDNWTACAYGALVEPLSNADIREMAIARDEVSGALSLFVAFRNSTSTERNMAQYVSHDSGASFVQVQSDMRTTLTADPTLPAIVSLEGGGFIVAFVDDDGTYAGYKRYKLTHAGQDIGDLALSGFGTGGIAVKALRGVALAKDDAGLLMLFTEGPTNENDTAIWSDDNGATWTQAEWISLDSTGATAGGYLQRYGVAYTNGRWLFLSRFTASTVTHDDESVICLYLGGHTTMTAPQGSTASSGNGFGRYARWADNDNQNINSGLWLPIGVPSSMAWTGGGTGGTFSATSTGGQIATSADTLYYSRSLTENGGAGGPLGNGPEAGFYEFALEIDPGDGNSTTDDIAAYIRFSDSDGAFTAAFVYEVKLRFESGRMRVYDPIAAGAVGSAVVLDFTSRRHVRVVIDKSGNVRVWTAADELVRTWTEVVDGTLTDDSGSNPGNTHLIQWGHQTSSTSTSRWALVGYCLWAYRWHETSDDTVGASWTNPDDLRGRSFGTSFQGLTDGIKVRAVGGPTYVGDTWQIDAAYRYALEHVFSDLHPSPQKVWRTTGTTEALLPFDLEATTYTHSAGTSDLDNAAIFVAVLGANVENLYLERWNGSTWVEVIELDATFGFTGLSYVRHGSTVRPDTGTSHSGATYILSERHTGDTFDFGTGSGASRYAKIGGNTAGQWTSATTKRPFVRLDEPDTGAPASGTAAIRVRDFVGVVHDHDATAEIYRIRIPAQDTADGYFEIGQIMVGRVEAFGHQHDEAWALMRERPMRREQLSNGRRRASKTGPSARSLDIAWAITAVDATDIQVTQAVGSPVDYIAGNTNPIAAVGDTVQVMEGVLEELELDATPVVMLRRVVTGSTTQTITQRDHWIYGRIVGQGTTVTNVQGDEGASEINRLSTLRIVEEV